MSDTRFTVGNTYTFLRILFEKGEKGFFRTLYVPWVDKLEKIETMELTCVEHCKVTDGYSDELKYDGFIFHDANGGIWHNQYPTASYGQLDDRNDRIVHLYLETGDIWVSDENGQAINDAEGLPVIKNQELYDKFDSYFWKPLELCTVLLSNIYRSANPRDRDHSNLTESERKQLAEFCEQVVANVEESNGKKVVFEPFVINYIDGKPPKTTDYYVAKIK